MYLLLALAVVCSLACGVHPSCVLLDTTTRDNSRGEQCFVRGDKAALRCCNVEGLVNASAADGSFQGCEVLKAFGGKGELLSREGVVLDEKEELLLCFSVQYTEIKIWLSCHHGNQVACVAIKSHADWSASDEKWLSKRSGEAVPSYTVHDSMQDSDKLEPVHTDSHVALIVSIATLGLLVLLVMLCASGSSKKHTFTNNNDIETGASPEHKQDNNTPVHNPESLQVVPEGGAEMQEVHLQMLENPGEAPPIEIQGNSPPEEGQGQAVPQGGGGGDDHRPEGDRVVPDVALENGGHDQEDDDDPRYDAVRHPQQQVQLPAAPAEDAGRPASPGGEAGQGVPQGNGVKISYAVVSRHPGQPPYASVSEVLPAAEAAQVDDDRQRDEEGYDQVILEKGEPKDGYAEVRIGSFTAEPAVCGNADTASQRDNMYDTVGYDSVNHPVPSSASQDSAKDDMYEVVPDSVRQLSPTRVKDVAPELPPMRVRGPSSSEDDSRLQSMEGSSKEWKKEGRGSKDNKPAKEKGGKSLGGIFRNRSSTVMPASKSKGKESSKEREVFEGPPLPPNHPPAGMPRTSTSSAVTMPRSSISSVPPSLPPPPPPEDDDCYSEPFDHGPVTGLPRKMTSSAPRTSTSNAVTMPRTSSSSVPPSLPPPPPPEDDDDCYSEPFDRGPATGPPRKVTNSARPYSGEALAMSKSSRGQAVPALSPRGAAPSFPLPDIPSLSEVDPAYESVSPETQRAALNRALAAADGEGEGEEEEEVPYDTVARIPGTSLSVSVHAMGDVAKQLQATKEEEEEEGPYDVVARVPGTSVGVSIGATVVATATGGEEEEEEEEETPYDTVKQVPGTSVAVSVGALGSALGGQSGGGAKQLEEHPYSKINKSKVHVYASVDKSKKQSEEDDTQPRHMTLPTASTLEHDDMGYAVVSEEFKRARTMSRDAQSMRALVKKKAPVAETSDYTAVADDLRKTVLTGAVNGGEGVASSLDLPSTPSPPPPISPIKDKDIILEFCAPEAPPHPAMELEDGSKSSKPSSRQLMLSTGDASSPEVEQTGVVTEVENPYETVDDDLKGYRESPQL